MRETTRNTGSKHDAMVILAPNQLCYTQVIYGGSHYHGPLSDVWVFNPAQGAWSQPTITGEAPAAREMHSGCMVDSHTMLVYGGRASDGR